MVLRKFYKNSQQVLTHNDFSKPGTQEHNVEVQQLCDDLIVQGDKDLFQM